MSLISGNLSASLARIEFLTTGSQRVFYYFSNSWKNCKRPIDEFPGKSINSKIQ